MGKGLTCCLHAQHESQEMRRVASSFTCADGAKVAGAQQCHGRSACTSSGMADGLRPV